VVAVERAGEIILDIPPSFVLAEDDQLYVCGTADAFKLYNEEFPAAG
jgi:K+/H+ antiporter YhaU regulatory subunit KhtT